jgi:hypothetical protein
MIIVFNPLTVILLLATGLPCFLVFGLGLTWLIGRPEIVGVSTGVSICVVAAILDLALRLRGDRRVALHDARFGAQIFFVPFWIFGPFTAAAILLGAR